MFRITQDPSSGSTDSYYTQWWTCGVCERTRTRTHTHTHTHTTGPEYAAKHRQRTQQALLNHSV
jgi:hypothetical protein